MAIEAEALQAILKQHIKVDATGLSPAVASAFVTGFDEAVEAIRSALAEDTARAAEGWRPINEAPKHGIFVVDGDGPDFVSVTGARRGPFLAHKAADEYSDNWPAWRVSGIYPPKIIRPSYFYLVPALPLDKEAAR